MGSGGVGAAPFGQVKEYATALLSEIVPHEERERRLAICKTCRAVDHEGKPLYRLRKGAPYCGDPWWREWWALVTGRDARAVGCGCNLLQKTRYAAAHCPREYW